MPGPIDKLELQFEDFNHSETSDTSEVQKCSFSENYLNLKTEVQTCLLDQALKA